MGKKRKSYIGIGLLVLAIGTTSYFLYQDRNRSDSEVKKKTQYMDNNPSENDIEEQNSKEQNSKEQNSKEQSNELPKNNAGSSNSKSAKDSKNTLEDTNGSKDPSNENKKVEDTGNSNEEKESKQEDGNVGESSNGQDATKVKGIYVTAPIANKGIDDLITLVDETELNTMVIDIKDDEGRITFRMDYEEAINMKATSNNISDIQDLVSKLKEKDIYLIARVVAFKDPILAENRPDLALKKKDGSIFRDKDGLAWVNPYKKEVWDYLVGVAKQCADIGFDEVNFDYIRFSTDKGISQVNFGDEAKNKTKIETITDFVTYAYDQLKPTGLFVSADVYGAIINSSVDSKIVGQSYIEMSKHLDYICPMIYPSHYGNGYYGINYPDTQPYDLIMGALASSKEVLNQIPEGEHRAIVRPWLQDFTAKWLQHYIKYGPEEVRDQINAVYDSGYEEWLLWNGRVQYTEGALYTEEEAVAAYKKRPTPTPLPTPKTSETPNPEVTQPVKNSN